MFSSESLKGKFVLLKNGTFDEEGARVSRYAVDLFLGSTWKHQRMCKL